MMGRRRFLLGATGAMLGSMVRPRVTAAQPAIVRLDERLSLVTTGGTNVVALATPDRLVVVDTGMEERASQLSASLRQLAPDGRVITVFNTHWHLEHTGANDLLRQGGAEIVAHENTRAWMAAPTWMPAEDRYRPARAAMAHPTRTFYREESMSAGRERIDCGYLLEAHTSGDIYVHFRGANVLAVGDVASPLRDPELDWFTGAWLGGRVDAMDRLLSLSDAATRIVPGVGAVMSRADLQAERDMLKTIYDRAVERVRQGDSADDMLDAGVMRGLPRTWNDPRRFLYDVHKGLWAHHNTLSADVV